MKHYRRVCITIPRPTLRRIDAIRRAQSRTRSGQIAHALATWLAAADSAMHSKEAANDGRLR